MIWELARAALFRLDPETAHDLTFTLLDACGRLLAYRIPEAAPVRLMGLTFPNRIGLAAGLDKNGAHIDALARLGFGFLEVGTVTPSTATRRNPRPRMFRLPQTQAVINRMGFNNLGVDRLARNVQSARYRGILGINIGKNLDTPIERAASDYLACMRKVYALASYLTINISSPNTKNLRRLQETDELDRLLAALKAEQSKLADEHARYVPIALKIAPDLTPEQLHSIAELLLAHRVDAVVATNTTLSRAGVEGLVHAEETGGLSGAPLSARSTQVVRELTEKLKGRIPIIGVGGIMRAEDAAQKLAAGASLVQLYTGLVYAGPRLVRECIRRLPA